MIFALSVYEHIVFIAVIYCLFWGIWVFIKQRTPGSLIFLLTTLSLGFWNISIFGLFVFDKPDLFCNLLYVSTSLTYVMYGYFSYHLASHRKKQDIIPTSAIFSLAALVFVLSACDMMRKAFVYYPICGGFYFPRWEATLWIFVLQALIIIGYLCNLIIRYHRQAAKYSERRQLRLFSLTTIVTIILSLLNFLPAIGVHCPPLSPLSTLIFCSLITYLLSTYRFLGISATTKASIIRAIILAIFVVLILALGLFCSELLRKSLNISTYIFDLVYLVGVAVCFYPLRSFIERFVNKKIMKVWYRYQKDVEDLIERLSSRFFYLHDFIDELFKHIKTNMHFDRTILLLKENEKIITYYSLPYSKGEFEVSEKDALVKVLTSTKVALVRSEIAFNWATRKYAQQLLSQFNQLEIEIAAPILTLDRSALVGILGVDRSAGLSRSDVDYIDLLAAGLSLALNRHLFYTERMLHLFSVMKSFITAIEAKDPYTAVHSRNVANYAAALAKKMHLPKAVIELIELSGYLHDVGKLGVDEYILQKPGRLTKEEFEQIKKHPLIGKDIISSLHLPSQVNNAILYHHERIDGSGYPYGIDYKELPLTAQIIAIADSYDAMTSDRPYRKALPKEVAIKELRKGAEKLYDPQLVDLFISTL